MELCLHAPPGVLQVNTLVPSRLHQMHLAQATGFDGATQGDARQIASFQPFSQPLPMSTCFLDVTAYGHVDDVTARRHTGPVKNGDAFERLALGSPWQTGSTK